MSVVGSKSSRPASASAITVSGDVTKLNVLAEPSLRLGKLRLYELTIVLGWPVMLSGRDHWPMHGPQALASTVAPTASRSASRPSRSIVERICSEPGVTAARPSTVSPLAEAWRAIDAARVMSSYDELVHDPMSAEEISSGQSFSRAAAPTSAPTRWARSGECGPLISGLSWSRSISTSWSYVRAVVGAQLVGHLVGGVGDRLAAGRLEVLRHVGVVREQRRGGADLGAHVADRSLAGGRDGVGAGTVVLDDRPGAALDGEHPGDLEDDVLRARPAATACRSAARR